MLAMLRRVGIRKTGPFMSFTCLAFALLASASSASLPAANEWYEVSAEVGNPESHAPDFWAVAELGAEDEVPEKFEDPKASQSHSAFAPIERIARLTRERTQKTSAASLLAHPARGPPRVRA